MAQLCSREEKMAAPSKNLPNSPSPGIALKSAVFCAPTKEEQACAYYQFETKQERRGASFTRKHNSFTMTIRIFDAIFYTASQEAPGCFELLLQSRSGCECDTSLADSCLWMWILLILLQILADILSLAIKKMGSSSFMAVGIQT